MLQCLNNLPVIIGSVAPVVPVIAVLLIRPFSWRGVVAIATRAAVHVPVGTSIGVVVLVAMWVIWMMPVSLPRLVAVARITVLSVPLPVPSVCKETVNMDALKAESTV